MSMVIYGEGSGTMTHAAQYGAGVSRCGVPIAPASRAYAQDEKDVTCPKCLEREALAREARQEALLDAGPILAAHRRAKGE